MADGLEQMRVAYEEISRLRESHGEVETWLTNTDAWTKKVQGQVKELSGMEPAVERIRDEVEQVKGAMGEIEARRETLNDVQRRLGDLGAVSAELKERADALRGRMETAESRFTQLAKQAEEAQLVADTMAEVTGSVSEAEKRMSTVDESVRALESRTSSSTSCRTASGCWARSSTSGRARWTRLPSTSPAHPRSGRKRRRRRSGWRRSPAPSARRSRTPRSAPAP